MLRNLVMVGMGPIKMQDLKSILAVHIQIVSGDWKAGVHAHIPKATESVLEVYEAVTMKLKVTPLTAQYCFTMRDIFKLIHGLGLVEGSHMGGKENLLKLWYHESMRTFYDRIVLPEDKEWFHATMRKIAIRCYDLVGQFSSSHLLRTSKRRSTR